MKRTKRYIKKNPELEKRLQVERRRERERERERERGRAKERELERENVESILIRKQKDVSTYRN